MTQPVFDWTRAVDAPISGLTPAARHASATGAQHAAVVRGALMRAMLRAFVNYGPRLTIAEVAAHVGRQAHAVTSTWSRLEALGWIEGTGTFRSYRHPLSGRTIKQEYHQLTARGREVAR